MPFQINIDTAGLAPYIKNLLDPPTMAEIHSAIGAEFEFMVSEQFEQQGAYWGDGWADLSPSYMRLLGRLGGYTLEPTLIRGRRGSEALSQSFAYEASSEGVQMGFSASYAAYLHFGTEFMPARPLLPDSYEDLTDEDVLVIIEIVGEIIERSLG